LRKRINSRKKEYVHFVEKLVGEVQQARQSKRNVSPRAATFALLGMINWIYQWYKPEGAMNSQQIAAQYSQIFFSGALS
jgi:TetR/AcrR family transcriptional regulator, cholesterol catabolism regulator